MSTMSSSRIIIQVLLIAAVGVIGWMMLRSPSGARHRAGRRIVTLAFVIFAIVSIAVPAVISRIAHFVGVGRGTDLLLYVLVIAFLLQILSSFRRNAALERQITRLARRVALDDAPAKLEVIVVLVNDGHGQTAKPHVHRALCLICHANGSLGLDVIGRDDDRHARNGSHEGEVLVALVGGAVLAHRYARVRGPDDHVQMGVADGVSHLLEGATGGEHGKGAREHPVPRGRDAGSDAHEVLLRYADVDEAVGIGRLELARLGRDGEIGVEHHEVIVGGT